MSEWVGEASKRLQTTSDDVIKREILREIIYKGADLLAVGVKVAGIRNYDVLDVKFQIPSEVSGDYPVPEQANVDISKVTWAEFGLVLQKAECRFMITDEAVLRQLDREQYNASVRRCSERLAYLKDENIINQILAGAGKSVAAAAVWTDPAAKPADDIVKAIGEILETKGVVETDIRNMALVAPIKAWAQLLKLQEIGQIKQSIADWLRETYGLDIMPSKLLGKDAVLLIKGPETVIHGVLRPGAKGIPQAEVVRHEGVGTEYIYRQFFNTVVVPDSKTVSTSGRICKITGVLT